MVGSGLSACVPCCWDDEFAAFRHDFSASHGNQTPDEYLGGLSDGSEYGDFDSGGPEAVARTVSRFMESAAGHSNGPSSIYQAEVAAAFCRHPTPDLWQAKNTKGQERRVALVYEWESKPSQIRRFVQAPVPLTHEGLLQKLCHKRFVDPDQPESIVGIDADRRLIYIDSLDPLIISILAKTTTCLETPVVQRTILRYLTARTCFDAHITVRGFKTFGLELNISYFSLRQGGRPVLDQRSRWDRKGYLRETLCSPRDPSSPCSIPGALYSIYETQLSIAVTGVDHWRWTAWAFVDNWFEPEDSVSTYYEGGETTAQPDPLAAGQVDVDPPIRYPREYFLKVFEIRILEIEKEWNYMLQVLQEEVQRIDADPLFGSPQRSFESEQGREKIRRLSAWNGDMIRLVGTLLKSLSRTLGAWDVFQKTDIGYFLYDDASCTKRPEQLLPSLRIIEKTFLNLHVTREELEQVRWSVEELGRGLARGEKNYATFVQQRTGEHIKLLTWVTIGWSPVVIATGMCSAQAGIFPFHNNIGDFFGAVLVIGGLVGVSIAVLLNRHSKLLEWKIMSAPHVVMHPSHSPDDEPVDNGGAEKPMTFPARAFSRQPTVGSIFSGRTLVPRLSGLRTRPTDLSHPPRAKRNDVNSMA
ncbi:hypothetical protein B0T24DRAFT_676328 [Lasiosphaeria ovina]|uniref:Uncharacterized protein n=1 Tax=Lasiosphaeria ovina TaxID=92902 RepID=A0AAE0NFM1_9PEZI|nr:hypothetical protein B0T24DRAFT_676328 [Lasiosphaeria ovina]